MYFLEQIQNIISTLGETLQNRIQTVSGFIVIVFIICIMYRRCKLGESCIQFLRIFNLGDHKHDAFGVQGNRFYHERYIFCIKSEFVGCLLHHITKQAFGFLCAISKLTDLELTICQICLGKSTTNLMVIYFFNFHNITSSLFDITAVKTSISLSTYIIL